jgi:hypothetical protein
MASAMNKINVSVTIDGETHHGQHVKVRDNVATVSSLGHEGVVKNGVTGVKLIGPKLARVSFVDGTEWTVEGPEPRKGCGCG